MRRSAEFARVFSQPIKVNAAQFTVVARRNDGNYPRLGMVVSKRSAKSAVARNRLKRYAREAFRHLQGQIGAVDLILITHPGILDQDNLALSRSFACRLRVAADKCATSSSG